MKNLKLVSILAIVAASFTACQKDNLMQPADLDGNNPGIAAKVVKSYIHFVTDKNGVLIKKFVYDNDMELQSISYSGSGIVQYFNYLPTGQLTSIDFFDPTIGQNVRQLNYTYTSNPNRPSSVEDFLISLGSPTLESETQFTWNAQDQKTNELITITATGAQTENIYSYTGSNMTYFELIRDGVVIGSRTYTQFDSQKNPYKYVPVLQLMPGFEYQTHNIRRVVSDRIPPSKIEKFAINYDANGYPLDIKGYNGSGTTTHHFFQYITL